MDETTASREIERMPPHDVVAEAAVLGSLMIDARDGETARPKKVIGMLVANDFFHEAHRVIYREIERLYVEGKGADPVLLRDALRGKAGEPESGWTYFILVLRDSVASPANGEHYAKIVQRKAMLRREMDEMRRLADAIHADDADADAIARTAAERFAEIAFSGASAALPEPQTAEQVCADGAKGIEWAWDGYLPTRGLVMLSADSGAGKTVLCMAALAMIERGERFLGRDTRKTRALVLTEEPATSLAQKIRLFGTGAVFLTRRALAHGLTWAQLVRAVAEMALRYECGIVVVDPFATWAEFEDDHEQGSGPMTRALKAALAETEASPTDLVFLILHHDTRDGRPMRGSGAIKAALDVGLHLTRSGDDDAPRVLKVVKTRDLRAPPPAVVVRLTDDGIEECGSADDARDENTVARLVPVLAGSGGLSADALASEAGIRKQFVYAALRNSQANGGRIVRRGRGKNTRWHLAAEAPTETGVSAAGDSQDRDAAKRRKATEEAERLVRDVLAAGPVARRTVLARAAKAGLSRAAVDAAAALIPVTEAGQGAATTWALPVERAA